MSDDKQLRPAPIRKRDNAFFWDGARQEELRVQQCNSCGHLQHPPGPMCPQCLGVDMGYGVLSGKGKVYSWIIPRYPQVPMFEEGLIVALVNMDEGVRLLSNLCGIAPHDIVADMEVEAFFVDAQDGEKIPQFRPVTK